MSITSLLKSIAFAVFCALLAYGGFRVAEKKLNSDPASASVEQDKPSSSKNLSYEQFDLAREFVNLSEAKESIAVDDTKIYLINFWASWCAPCVTEMPLLEQVSVDYASQGLTVVGLSNDDTIGQVNEFLKQIPVSYPMFMNDNETIAATSELNPIGAIPFSLFVNAKGDILDTKLGIFEEGPLNSQIESLLQE